MTDQVEKKKKTKKKEDNRRLELTLMIRLSVEETISWMGHPITYSYCFIPNPGWCPLKPRASFSSQTSSPPFTIHHSFLLLSPERDSPSNTYTLLPLHFTQRIPLFVSWALSFSTCL